MSIKTSAIQYPKDFEPRARESFFVAVCDCDESSFVYDFGCSHPFHVVPLSALEVEVGDGVPRS
jgi:hypothetical protein